MTPVKVWERRRLKYAATLNDETLPETTDPDYELLYIDIGNVDSSGYIHDIAQYRFDAAPSRARRKVKYGDVIISTVRTYLQAIASIEGHPNDLIVSTEFAVVRPRPNILITEYCKYALREPRFIYEVEGRSTGVSYPAINASELSNIKVEIPNILVQQRIAKYLDRETSKIDALIKEKMRMLALLAEKRAALISHAVTHGLDPYAILKPSGYPWLGDIPVHWEIRRCATLFKEIDERNQSDLPLLNVSLNTGVSLRVFSDNKIESVAADFTTYKVARKGNLVFNKMRFWQGAVGIAPEDGLTSPDYTVAEFIPELNANYIEFLFRIPQFIMEVRRHSHGIVDDRLRLYWDGFKNIRIPLPPPHEQKFIVDHLNAERDKTNELEAALRNSIELLKERRSALITAAVTGQLKISGEAA